MSTASQTPNPRPSRISGEAFETMVAKEMGNNDLAFVFSVEAIHEGFVRLRLRFDKRQLRPGGTIAGPVMFTLSDTALFAAVLSKIGMVKSVVTTDMNIHFLRRPKAVDMIAECRLIKAGRQLIFGEVFLYSDGDEQPVAHATGTYAVPAKVSGEASGSG